MTSTSAPSGPPALLDAALRRDPARPLLTFYDDQTGERAELSVTTFATWVAKTANLLRDDLDVGPGNAVSVDLPVHWQAAVWLQASWAVGASVVPRGADVAVISYAGTAPVSAPAVVALGLGLLGLPRTEAPPPAGTTLDYDREIASHGDRFVPSVQPDPGAPALDPGVGAALSGAALGDLAHSAEPLPDGARLLVAEPLGSLPALLAGLLVPLATGVTAVLVRHLDPSRLTAIVDQEGIVATATPLPAGALELPRWDSRVSGPVPPIP